MHPFRLTMAAAFLSIGSTGCGKGLKLYSSAFPLPHRERLALYFDAQYPLGIGRKNATTVPGFACAGSPFSWRELVSGTQVEQLGGCNSPQFGWHGTGASDQPYRFEFGATASPYFEVTQRPDLLALADGEDFTIEGWVALNPTVAGTRHVLALSTNSANSIVLLQATCAIGPPVTCNLTFTVTLSTTGPTDACATVQTWPATGPTFTAQTPVHFAFRVSGSTLTALSGGAPATTSPRPAAAFYCPSASTKLRIGSFPATNGMDGGVALLALHRQALSDDQLRDNCRAILPRFAGLAGATCN